MAQKKKAATDGTATNTEKLNIKGINIPPQQQTCVKSDSRTSQEQIKEAGSTYKIENRGRKPIMDRIADRLDDLITYVSQGLENVKIAELLGIGESTFYRLMSDNQEFKEAYQKGIDNRKYNLEKALLKRAEGFEAIETVTEKDDKGNVVKTKTTNKHYVPDTTALIFSLKNLYGDKYKDRVETVTDININYNQIQQLTNEELVKMASNIVNADYQIEWKG